MGTVIIILLAGRWRVLAVKHLTSGHLKIKHKFNGKNFKLKSSVMVVGWKCMTLRPECKIRNWVDFGKLIPWRTKCVDGLHTSMLLTTL